MSRAENEGGRVRGAGAAPYSPPATLASGFQMLFRVELRPVLIEIAKALAGQGEARRCDQRSLATSDIEAVERPLPVSDGFIASPEGLRRTSDLAVSVANFPTERTRWWTAPADHEHPLRGAEPHVYRYVSYMWKINSIILLEPTSIRGLAQRTRQLARGLTLESDRARLEQYADELDQRAAVMEARTAFT